MLLARPPRNTHTHSRITATGEVTKGGPDTTKFGQMCDVFHIYDSK
jgi:hypothetical protein